MRVCRGCDEPIKGHPRMRNPKRWCSESCRVRTYRANNPDAYAQARENNRVAARAAYTPVRHQVICVICLRGFESRRPEAKYCSDTCRFKAARSGRRGRRAGVLRERYTITEIGDRDRWLCQICDDPVERGLKYPELRAASIDHRIPLARGGDDTLDNVQLAHLDCNRRKGAREPAA